MGLLPTAPCSDAYVSLQCGAVVVRMAAEGVQLGTMVWAARSVGIFLQPHQWALRQRAAAKNEVSAEKFRSNRLWI